MKRLCHLYSYEPLINIAVLPGTVKPRKTSEEDDDIFGSYAPSAVSSRPGTGRSVR